MSAHVEWLHAAAAEVAAIPADELDAGEVGVCITDASGDGVIVFGTPVEVLKVLVKASSEAAKAAGA